jgi:hypothetical protein
MAPLGLELTDIKLPVFRNQKDLDTTRRGAAAGVNARAKGLIVSRDACPYFERWFGIEASGPAAINPTDNPDGNPEAKPSAVRGPGLRHKLRTLNAVVACSKPQLGRRLIVAVVERTEAKPAASETLRTDLWAGRNPPPIQSARWRHPRRNARLRQAEAGSALDTVCCPIRSHNALVRFQPAINSTQFL